MSVSIRYGVLGWMAWRSVGMGNGLPHIRGGCGSEVSCARFPARFLQYLKTPSVKTRLPSMFEILY